MLVLFFYLVIGQILVTVWTCPGDARAGPSGGRIGPPGDPDRCCVSGC